ncbi:hypothetical protein EHI8A_025790 [Entamoeba histolytica HM-1:IMSS-B]|uniref:Uncharacterized protein n=6 Tax=Entamoeba histolytica TaxID=5759 RepID=C4LVE1_ENTH1|nr:hypothetical protein EHI_197240 [Entamoeba histolytica HM-1:IMSS]EMD49687.1 Hypothetical protein EHI5A_022850 [Entamoeba histolytica KU27]EMH72738.1 hypothetical protein EHI8A_025790 [Entamoeba histolytica HM-1:IMSS-B]EMS16106.1 hypothetical protein KM1_025220 [Entamoeba histolytica HM-3:IMSS]ENY63093.1 hypothetical protein EHI7A_029070 [Entamoeba histolytica HM-1:IMSS-A]GAT92629.1 hypothetical protein CL6EHI_197240 [Entamoeba histolytica]|eukprot:XP_653982.1 hypothetical protein EHI_197240 [Entamoeba histolytica HM-1:IMSS]
MELFEFFQLINDLLIMKPNITFQGCKVVSMDFFIDIQHRLRIAKQMCIDGKPLSSIQQVIHTSIPLIQSSQIKSIGKVYSPTLINSQVILDFDVIIIDQLYQSTLQKLNNQFNFTSLPEVFIKKNNNTLTIIKEYPIVTVFIKGLSSSVETIQVTTFPNELMKDFKKKVLDLIKIKIDEYQLTWSSKDNKVFINENSFVPNELYLSLIPKFTSFSTPFTSTSFSLSFF